MILTGETDRQKSVQVPVRAPQIPQKLARDEQNVRTECGSH